MRVLAAAMLIPRRAYPAERVLVGKTHFLIAAIIDVSQGIAVDGPFERFDIRCVFAYLENKIDVRAGREEF